PVPRRFAQRNVLLGEYFATKMSSHTPPLTGPPPKSTTSDTDPTTTTFPLLSVATPYTRAPSLRVPGLIVRAHRNWPPLALVVTVTTAVSLLAAPCVSVTVIIAVYGPALV